VEPATDKLVNVDAGTDGPEVPAQEETEESELPSTTALVPPVVLIDLPPVLLVQLIDLPPVLLVQPTDQPPVPLVQPTDLPLEADAHCAHTRTPNVVELNVVTATDKPEFALARTDGLEVPALLVTAVLETSLTDPELLDALIAHTEEPNAVVPTVVLATDKPENALAGLNGAVVLAATEEESLELVTHGPTALKPTLLTKPHPAPSLFGLRLLEFWPQYALSSWSW